jgi:ubiquinone/menaquinone biosynthesis C-methylase UbiE
MKTSYWKKEVNLDLDQEKPIGLVRNVAFEMKKRNLSDVLELGCGRGRNCIWLAKEHFSVTGIDYNLNDLLLIKEYVTTHNLSVTIVQNDVSALSFKENTFDVVLSFNVLTYITEKMRKKVAEEVKKVLRPQGLFVLVERSPKDPLYKMGKELEPDTYFLEGLAHHFFSLEEFQSLLSPRDIAAHKERRTIDTAHDLPHVHGVWVVVALNKK